VVRLANYQVRGNYDVTSQVKINPKTGHVTFESIHAAASDLISGLADDIHGKAAT